MSDGSLTEAGVSTREDIERDSDRRTATLYESLDTESRDRWLAALRSVAGRASRGLPS